MLKILNLYAGLGGNRTLWGDDCLVTAVEKDPKIAEVYGDRFPKDRVIVRDAHQYLEDHYNEFDFIWSSPPCTYHSGFRQHFQVKVRGSKPRYPDFKLYEEIVFLQNNFKGLWVVENVKPYYKPLVDPQASVGRHLVWSSKIEIDDLDYKPKEKLRRAQIPDLQKYHGIDLSPYNGLKEKRKLLRNCVDAEIGKYIFDVVTDAA